jgi:ketosteroid isomerase-like protein
MPLNISANREREFRLRIQMRTVFSLSLMMSAILTAACGPSGSIDSDAAEAAAIQKLDEQWSATAARNDGEGTIAFYADDAVLLPPNAPIATNQQSIRQSWAALLGPNTAVSWKVSKAEVAKSGELGYLYGTYTPSRMRASDKTLASPGSS